MTWEIYFIALFINNVLLLVLGMQLKKRIDALTEEHIEGEFVPDLTPLKNGFKAYVPSQDSERVMRGLEEDQFREH